MAQTTQIVPRFPFPYIETVVNDYTQVIDDTVEVAEDTSITQIYAVTSSKGIDNKWIRKTTRSDAVKTYGESNFKLYGQPLMQALNVLDQYNSSVWMMRVMPENATFSNAIASVFYKADTEVEESTPHKRKFRIKIAASNEEGIETAAQLAAASKSSKYTTSDAEGYAQLPLMTIRYAGRGTCGDFYSMRISQNLNYEKEYGIKMYNFEIITSEVSIARDANYVGSLVTSMQYSSESTTLIDDVLADVPAGVAPVALSSFEDNVETVYNAYIDFLKTLHDDCVAEYAEKLEDYDIPQDVIDGTVPVPEDLEEEVAELREIEAIIDATEDSELPTIDQFDIIYGRKVASSEMLPNIAFPTLLTDDVDTEEDDYDPDDYTVIDNLANFSSVKGATLTGGTNGYFDNPRSVEDPVTGEIKQWTYEDEVAECFKNAYNGIFDAKILSARRMRVSAFFDANYRYDVKLAIADVCSARDDCRGYFDIGIVNTLSATVIKRLNDDYNVFDDHMFSIDIHNYLTRESSTLKKCNVTISYFLSQRFIQHYNDNSMQVPMVKANCQLSGHVRDSVYPIVEEYNTSIKEALYNSRFNYFECINDNVFQRGVQNTTQKVVSDLLEENNSYVLYNLKRRVELDANDQIYNFADESVRADFITVEKAKLAPWQGVIVQSVDIRFEVSQYEFEHSILHLYLAVVFRGLTKQVIIEIDINKRQYEPASEDTE